VNAVNPIFAKASTWMVDPKNNRPFPMPINLRFSEMQDIRSNSSATQFCGEVLIDQGIKAVQDACGAVVALARN
jgi:hypothetical protein